MCGIYGMISPNGAPLRRPDLLARMGDALKHRGPDARGTMALPHAAVGVNRLRIVDLHSRADQPFVDHEHCVSLAFNGEIYNAAGLRRRFSGYPYRSHSDAETLLPLYLEQGVAGIADVEGMFGLAIWDEGSRTLVLARDGAGEKPLFYLELGNEIWFASEIGALLVSPLVNRSLDPAALNDYLTFGYVREPRTMFSAIRKVEAGRATVFEGSAASRGVAVTSPPAPLPPGPGAGSAGEGGYEATLGALLEESVRKQLVADVPVGVFLSGGVDSSCLASIASRHGGQRLNTFSVRFAEHSYDEGDAARRLSRGLGTRHSEIMADSDGLREAYDAVFSSTAEPLADPAVLPTFLLARRAREEVGVVLSGEGADELFGGYPTYLGHALAAGVGRLPSPFRHALGKMASLPLHSTGAVPLGFLLRRFIGHAARPWRERHIAWFGTGLADRRIGASAEGERSSLWPAAGEHPVERSTDDVLTGAMLFDYHTYLRDGLLPKIDRATMLVSLEARAPFLDPAIVRFAFALPNRFKVRGLTTKWLLKRAARKWLPPWVIRRRKHGLSVPISGLINGVLRQEVDRLLAPAVVARQGLLNPEPVSQLLSEHRGGNSALARGIWALVVLQRWLEKWT